MAGDLIRDTIDATLEEFRTQQEADTQRLEALIRVVAANAARQRPGS